MKVRDLSALPYILDARTPKYSDDAQAQISTERIILPRKKPSACRPPIFSLGVSERIPQITVIYTTQRGIKRRYSPI